MRAQTCIALRFAQLLMFSTSLAIPWLLVTPQCRESRFGLVYLPDFEEVCRGRKRIRATVGGKHVDALASHELEGRLDFTKHIGKLLRLGAAPSRDARAKAITSKEEYLRQRLYQARPRLEAQDDGLRPDIHQPLRLRGQDHVE